MTLLSRLADFFKESMRGDPRIDIREFQRLFGIEICPICSFHRYGMREGLEECPAPNPHVNCPEQGWGRFPVSEESSDAAQ